MKEKRMDINRENAMRLWKQRYGKATRVKDFAGREMEKGAYDQRGSEFGWNLDHILPKSRGGKDTDSNLICTHILTNDEKADKYPVFTANKKQFEIIKVENHYEIREKPTVKKPASVQNQDVAKSNTTIINEPVVDITTKVAMDIWKKHYGKDLVVKDFSGRRIDKQAYGQSGSEYGWTVTHILPKKHGGKTVKSNLICAHLLTEKEKADKYPVFSANGKQFEIVKVGDHHEIKEKAVVKNTATNSESNDTANQSSEDRGINFFDTTAGIKCYESYKKDFWGSVTIEIERPENAAIVDFIKELFSEYSVSTEYSSPTKITVTVSGIRLTTKATIQEQLDDCMLLNSYLKYYFLRKKIIDGYTIFCEAHTQAEELKCYKAQNKHNGYGYYVKDKLLINELVRINTDAKKNRNESQRISTGTDSVGYYVYEYDYYWTKVKENLEKK